MRAKIRRHKEHSILRARERYGLDLSEDDYKRLCLGIAAGDQQIARFMVSCCLPSHRGKSVWLVRHEETWMVAVVTDVSKRIVTFLPPWAQFTDCGYPIFERRVA